MRGSFARIARSLPRAIRARRISLGLTQEELSNDIGVTPRHYQKIEAGRSNPTLRTLCAIADALKISVSELLALP